jgi:hypothetical protein
MPGQSIDLHNRCTEITELMQQGWDATSDTGQTVETENGAEPDAGAVVLRKLYEINAEKPLAVNVLLDAAVGRLNCVRSAQHLRVSLPTVWRTRSWLQKNHADLAACLSFAD